MFDTRTIPASSAPGTRQVQSLLRDGGDGLRRGTGGTPVVRRTDRERTRGRARSIELKSPAEITAMRMAGRLVQQALEAARKACVPGATTAAVDAAAAAVIEASGGESLFLNYPTYVPGEGFPARTCVSVNEEVVHGIPGRRRIAEGDLVTVDCGVRLGDWCADAAVTVPIGRVRIDWMHMLETSNAILDEAIAMVRPGRRWSDIAARMERMAADAGYGVVREYVGHGIGRRLHEPPQAPGFVTPEFLRDQDFTLRPGMVVAIEPMLTLSGSKGRAETIELGDGWTVVTADGCPAVHSEHTVAVVRGGAEVLTDGR